MLKSTSIILVNWQNYPDTLACLVSLKPYFAKGQKVVVVDNASPNESVAELEKWAEEKGEGAVTIVKAAQNRGFAAGNNIGIRYALEQHAPDFIWLLNNDTTVKPGCLEALLAAARAKPEVRIWGSTVRDFDPPHALQSAGGFRYSPWLSIPTPIRFAKKELPKGLFCPLPEMDYISGVSMFVEAKAFRKFGLMEEEYFLYYEELELTRKVGGTGYLGWCPDSVVFHKGGGSTGSQNPNEGKGSFAAHYYGNLSALRYTWRHHKLAFPLVFLFRLLAKSALFVRHGSWGAFRPLFKAYFDFIYRRDAETQGNSQR